MPQTDVLIIGSGIAGLSVAIKVARAFPDRHCTVITKQESAESNTRYAQGGIAVVSDFENDSFEDHIRDTLAAGDGLCDPAVVEHVVHQAPDRLRELIALGADFDRDSEGQLILGREGGHKANRIIHFQDVTGLNISTALLEKVKVQPNITLLSHHVAVDLLTADHTDSKDLVEKKCIGASVLSLESNRIETYLSAVTVLATGGTGQLYSTTTNPLIATGDGIAMAYRAGASVSNMEFIQFHPTALYDVHSSPAFLISEAVRGQGAYLRDHTGERFMFRYHIDGELACRDVVSRAIASEIELSGRPYVYLDCTHIDREILLHHFPNIYKTCLSKGLDIAREYIPVAPAAHYLCGGIDVDMSSRSTILNLYACGECSNTGLHGANRLASNSLLEATVFAHNCYEDIYKQFSSNPLPGKITTPAIDALPVAVEPADIADRKTSLQTLMSRFANIVRSNQGLDQAYHELSIMEDLFREPVSARVHTPGWYELRNMITCAKLIVAQSRMRKENRGGFYNRDFEIDQMTVNSH